MNVKRNDENPEPSPDPTPLAPDSPSLAPGVWVTEAPGFACVPPRAQSDFRNAADEANQGPGEDRSTDKECDTTLSQDDVEPRIERYRER